MKKLAKLKEGFNEWRKKPVGRKEFNYFWGSSLIVITGLMERVNYQIMEINYKIDKYAFESGTLSSAPNYDYGQFIGMSIIPAVFVAEGLTRIIGTYFNKPSLEHGIIAPAALKTYDFVKTRLENIINNPNSLSKGN